MVCLPSYEKFTTDEDNPNEIKMSAVILKIAEPYIKLYWGNEIRVRGIISLAIAAWNMTFLPQEKQNEFQEQLIEEILPNDCDSEDIENLKQKDVNEFANEKINELYEEQYNEDSTYDLAALGSSRKIGKLDFVCTLGNIVLLNVKNSR